MVGQEIGGGSMNYANWIASKGHGIAPQGLTDLTLSDDLFPHQKYITDWALRLGRAAVFADTGMGKTLIQCEWARHVSQQHGRVLILAPLAVAEQTVREAARFGIDVTYRREHDADLPIVIANYEMIDHFDASKLAGIVLDESSILKSYSGAFRNRIIEMFRNVPFKLACTATPAPNDHMELGNHAEFLGVRTRAEMLAEYFVHDGGSTQKWRLKKHAVDLFWQWVSTWAVAMRMPSDLGFDDAGFELPPRTDEEIAIPVDHVDAHAAGELFALESRTLNEQRRTRRATMDKRVDAIARAIAAEPDEPAIVWCELNDEATAITKAIPGAVNVQGSDKTEAKAERMLGFASGRPRVLVTKPKIAGFGMNWQHCARVYFMGPSHSFEQTYQATRRCWRYGQEREVIVRTCVAETEGAIARNLKRKYDAAETMAEGMREWINSGRRKAESNAGKVAII